MEYELFKKTVCEKIKNYLPEEYADYSWRVNTTLKVNRKLDTLYITPPKCEEGTLVPNLYFNDLYRNYQMCGDIDEVLTNAALVVTRNYTLNKKPFDVESLKELSSKIIACVINTEMNKELLDDLVHKEYLDLSIMYRVVVGSDETGLTSIIVSNLILKNLGLTPEEIHSLAIENTKRLFPFRVETMEDLFAREGFGKIPGKSGLYVITNAVKLNGASAILFEELFFELANKLNENLYIIPSSIHEVLAVSEKQLELEKLSEMVKNVNDASVLLEERLSDSVYYYDRKKRCLEIASQTQSSEC